MNQILASKKENTKVLRRGFLRRGGLFVYQKFLAPRSKSEDLQRREFILNIILCASLAFAVFGEITVIYNMWFERGYNGVSWEIPTAILAIFLGMYISSRMGYFMFSSYIFVGFYYAITTYSAYRWGTYLPSTLLNYVLLIIIASILISTRVGFLVTAFISAALGVIGYREVSQGFTFEQFWADKMYRFNDVVEFMITFFIIMTVSWLSNREIEKSLKRARRSEQELAKERDNLEITVEQRTQKIRELQAERVRELHRLAESGRQAAGFFHDLMNPLSAIALSIQDLRNKAPAMAGNVQQSLDQALAASSRMENFIDAIRRQSKSEEKSELFSLNHEIEQAILLLQHKAKKAQVKIMFEPAKTVEMTGKPLQFYQIVSNLVSNAIESYTPEISTGRNVHVELSLQNNKIVLKVTDSGKGIDPEMKGKVFDYFFTTKNESGMGLGLAITKTIVEKDFGGNIEIESSSNNTAFVVSFPLDPDANK